MNPSTALARLVVDQLIVGGVTDFVISPGSRSAPLAMELARRELAGELRLHVRIDERSAGFLALGMAKESWRPVPVICTSGTAVANLSPAVVEASYAGIALVVITADRPAELRNVGSNQTIDQVGFFGNKVQRAIDLGPLSEQTGSVAAAREQIARSLHLSGPVHVNLGFREPLTPEDGDWIEDLSSATQSKSTDKGPLREPLNYVLADIGIDGVPPRAVLLVGDVPTPEISRQIVELAQACDWPIVSEPSGNVLQTKLVVPAASLLLENSKFIEDNRPELLISVGRFGLSRSVVSLVRDSPRHIAIHVGGRDRPDPLRTAEAVLSAVPLPPDPQVESDGEWAHNWIEPGANAHSAVLAAADSDTIWGLSVAHTVWQSCSGNDLLFVASSRPVRDIELLLAHRDNAPRVIGNRGVSGIDGLVSTAWGAALAHGGRTVALLGDLAFLHDHNGLIAPISEPRPDLTIVVSDNNGGGIFAGLEQGAPEYADVFERVFGTAHDQDLAAIAAAAGIDAIRITDLEQLRSELASPGDGVRVLVVPTIPRGSEQQLHRKLRDFG